MIDAEEIRQIILKEAKEYGAEKTFRPADIARKIDMENWRGILPHVNIVTDVMIKEGQLILIPPTGALKFGKL